MMTMSENPTVALVGPGAIGTTIAAALHEVGRTPTICGRSARERLELRFDGGRIVVPGPVQIDPAEIKNTFDLVFVGQVDTNGGGGTVAFCIVQCEDCCLRAAKRR
jgi:2-dehydropantoate 2-reductase